jgi:nitrite reductase/ring-hydroxylating ferredoxin subunit
MLRLAVAIFSVLALVCLLAPQQNQFFAPHASLRAPVQQVEVGPMALPVQSLETRFDAPAQDSYAGMLGWGFVGFAGSIALLGVAGKAATRTPQDVVMSGAVGTKQVWVDFAKAKDCQPGTIISGFQYGQELAIACEKGGKLYAMSNKMPPVGQPATFATLDGKGTIVEPVTGTKFNMSTGKPVGKWCPSLVGNLIGLLVSPSNLFVFPVRKSGNSVQCLINVNAKKQFESNYWRGVLDAQGKVDGGYY